MSTFWLSFTDYSLNVHRHRHIITTAEDVEAAAAIARGLGAVGVLSISDLDACDPLPPAAFHGRVLTDADIDDIEAAVAAERSKVVAVAAIQPAILLPQGDDEASVRRPCAGDFATLDAILLAADVATMPTVAISAPPCYCGVLLDVPAKLAGICRPRIC
jgi:hypothetical protein